MGREYDAIDDRMAAFLAAQPVFFVATAPLGADGHLNLSPKGLTGTFAVVGPSTVAWLDLTGSGIETVAHLRENGRIVVMFCAFEGPPRIVRLHGRGEAVLPGDDRFDRFVAASHPIPAPARSSGSRSTASPTPAATASRSCATSATGRSSTSGRSARARTASPATGPRRTPPASTASRASPGADTGPAGGRLG